MVISFHVMRERERKGGLTLYYMGVEVLSNKSYE